MPKALGSCPDKMRVPTPVVKPAMTETGTNLATTPRRVTPEANFVEQTTSLGAAVGVEWCGRHDSREV